MFRPATALHSPWDEQRLAVRRVSELGTNPVKRNKESKREWDEKGGAGGGIIFTVVIITNIAIILQSHAHEQRYSQKHLGKWLRNTEAPGSLFHLRLGTWWSLGRVWLFSFYSESCCPPLFPQGSCSPSLFIWSQSRMQAPSMCLLACLSKQSHGLLLVLGILLPPTKGKTRSKKEMTSLGKV